MAIFVVDRFPRNKYMAGAVLGCMTTLIVEAALVANFVPSNNKAALQAAVAMFYIFQVFYGGGLDGNHSPYFPISEWAWWLTFNTRHTILLPRGDLPDTHPGQGHLFGCGHDLFHEYHLAASSSNGIRDNWLEILSLLHHPWHHRCSVHVDFLARYQGFAVGRNCCDLWRRR